jgi:transcription elongation factor SPT6
VNEVGIDLNFLIDHDHMQGILQFVSGLGPRKVKRILGNMRGKAYARKDFIDSNLMEKNVFMSAIAFLKIKIPAEDLKNYP